MVKNGLKACVTVSIHDAGRTSNDKWHYIGSILV